MWYATSFNNRLQMTESYESASNVNSAAQMLFVSCPNWGVNANNNGLYDLCPHASTTNDNGNLQGYTEMQGGPGYSQLQTISQTFGYDNLNRLNSAAEGTTWTRNFGYDQ